MKEKFLNNKKGITLIALVVTIVVLIILAIISINAVLGENGLIKRAEKASRYHANAEEEERLSMEEFDKYLENFISDKDTEEEQEDEESSEIKITYSYTGETVEKVDMFVNLQFELPGKAKYEKFCDKYLLQKKQAELEEIILKNEYYIGSFEEFLQENNMTREDIIEKAQNKNMTYEEYLKSLIKESEWLLIEYNVVLAGGENKSQSELESLFIELIKYEGDFDDYIVNEIGTTRENFLDYLNESGCRTEEDFVKSLISEAYENEYSDQPNRINVTLPNGKIIELYVNDFKAETEIVVTQENSKVVATTSNGLKGEANIEVNPVSLDTSKWDLNKVQKVTSEDNVIVPVPIGYTASTIEGEKRVDTGFVIKEGSDGSATSGINEFVWVPVPNIAMIYDEKNKAGQLWKFSKYGSSGWEEINPAYKINYTTSSCEPDVITEPNISSADSTSGNLHDAISSNLQLAGLSSTATVHDFKIQLQNEFDEMIESVKKYKGFYIGRYETGNLSKQKAVVQRGNSDINNKVWYNHYKLSKSIAANENVVSGMIWGTQWDATLRWMQNYGTSEKIKNFPTNSTGSYGNYKNNSIEYIDGNQVKRTTEGTAERIPTGSSEITNINNIYDMAGNEWDWTLETMNKMYRVAIGGDCNSDGSTIDAYSLLRPNEYYQASIGSRSSLYIAP